MWLGHILDICALDHSDFADICTVDCRYLDMYLQVVKILDTSQTLLNNVANQLSENTDNILLQHYFDNSAQCSSRSGYTDLRSQL